MSYLMSGAAGSSRSFSSGLLAGPQVTVIPPRPVAATVTKSRLLFTNITNFVAIDVPFTFTVNLQKLISLTIAVNMVIQKPVNNGVKLARTVLLSFNIPFTLSVALQRLIFLTLPINVSFVVTMVENALLHVSIAISFSFTTFFEAIAVFPSIVAGSLRKKRRGPLT